MTQPKLSQAAFSVAEAKRRFSELIERVGRGERVLVARRGKPVLTLAPPDAPGRVTRSATTGLAALAGALGDWKELEAVMADIYASRRRARDRRAPRLGR